MSMEGFDTSLRPPSGAAPAEVPKQESPIESWCLKDVVIFDKGHPTVLGRVLKVVCIFALFL